MPAIELGADIFPRERKTHVAPPEEFFQNEVESSPFPVLTYYSYPDVYKTDQFFQNAKFAQQFGYSQIDLISTPSLLIDNIFSGEKNRVVKEFLEKIHTDGKYEGVYSVQALDGWHVVYDHSELVKGKQGEVLYFKCSLTDITELARLREENGDLKEDHIYMRGLIEALDQISTDIIITTNEEGICQNISAFAPKKSLGIDAITFVNKNLLDRVHPDDKQRVQTAFINIKNRSNQPPEEGTVTVKFRLQHENGEWIWFEGSGIYKQSEENVGRYIINARNINKRKQAEAKVISQAKYSQALAEAISAINSPQNEKEILDVIAQQIGNIVDYTSASIHFVDEKDGIPNIIMSDRWNGTEHQRVIKKVDKNQPASDYPPIEQVIKTGVPVIVQDTTNSPLWNNRESKTKSYMGVPLVIEGKVVAVLNLNNISAGKYTDADLQRLTPFASAISVAIGKAQQYERIKNLSWTDELTQVYNRRYLHEFGNREFNIAQHDGRDITTFMLDIDDFKIFNDKHGHKTGDLILKNIARKCRSSLKNKLDIFARYGGEEFTGILPGVNSHDGIKISERVRQALYSTTTITDHGSFHNTVSIGLASYNPNSMFATRYKSYDDLREAADIALYAVKKKGGKNAVGIYIPMGFGPDVVAVVRYNDKGMTVSTVATKYSFELQDAENLTETEKRAYENIADYTLAQLNPDEVEVVKKSPDGDIKVGIINNKTNKFFKTRNYQLGENESFTWISILYPQIENTINILPS